MMSCRQQYSFELIRPRPTGYLRLLLNQAEILFPPYVFRIVEEGNERQVGLADLQVTQIHTSRQDVFRNTARRTARTGAQ